MFYTIAQLLRRPLRYYPCPVLSFADNTGPGSRLETSVRLEDVNFVCTEIAVITRNDDRGTVLTGENQTFAGGTDIGGYPDPGVLIEIVETGLNRALANAPLDALIFGTAEQRRLPIPKAFKRGTAIQVAVTSLRLAVANEGLDVRVVFCGYDDLDS